MAYTGHIHIQTNWENQFTKKQKEILAKVDSPKVRTEMNRRIGQQMNYFVPNKDGHLRSKMHPTPTGISWLTPYARYQYNGYVYSPNIPFYNVKKARTSGTGSAMSLSANGYFHTPKGTHKTKTSRRLGESSDFDIWTTTKNSIYGGIKRVRVHFKMGYTTPNTGYEWDKKFMTSNRIKNANQSITYYLTHLKY